MKINKRAIEIILTISILFCMVNVLEAIIFDGPESPNFAPNAKPSISDHKNIRGADGWYPEYVSLVKEIVFQPDGVEIEFEWVSGGENNPDDLYRIDGFTIIKDETGFWCWAKQGEDGSLESTGSPVHLYDPVELGLKKNIRMTRERALIEEELLYERMKKEMKILDDLLNMNNNSRANEEHLSLSTVGDINQIVIYVSFDNNAVCKQTKDEMIVRVN